MKLWLTAPNRPTPCAWSTAQLGFPPCIPRDTSLMEVASPLGGVGRACKRLGCTPHVLNTPSTQSSSLAMPFPSTRATLMTRSIRTLEYAQVSHFSTVAHACMQVSEYFLGWFPNWTLQLEIELVVVLYSQTLLCPTQSYILC